MVRAHVPGKCAEVKPGKCPAFISTKQGTGKTTIVNLFDKMMGGERVMMTANPAGDCFANFNKQLQETYLINLNEFDQSCSYNKAPLVKQLITDNKVNINIKGVDGYSIQCYHQFIITTNNPTPVQLTEDDRRYVVVQSSNELKGNLEYFRRINEIIDNPRFRRAIYEHLMDTTAFPDLDKFLSLQPPEETEYSQSFLRTVYKDPVLLWLENLVRENFVERANIYSQTQPPEIAGPNPYNPNQLRLTGSQALERFINFCELNRIQHSYKSHIHSRASHHEQRLMRRRN
jgi:hypothetical protein